ncbi:MAG: hypothetical protein ABFS19_01410 [Thermodesulfobacteriota bacterium]
MFSEMVRGLEHGRLPDILSLRGRLHAALIKKLALVQQPPTYWESDPKRNPVTEHLFWAAILVEDQESLNTVKSIVLVEAEVGGRHQLSSFVDSTLKSLLSVSDNPQIRESLLQKVDRLECGL